MTWPAPICYWINISHLASHISGAFSGTDSVKADQGMPYSLPYPRGLLPPRTTVYMTHPPEAVFQARLLYSCIHTKSRVLSTHMFWYTPEYGTTWKCGKAWALFFYSSLGGLKKNERGCQYPTMRPRKALGRDVSKRRGFGHRRPYSDCGGDIDRAKPAQRGAW